MNNYVLSSINEKLRPSLVLGVDLLTQQGYNIEKIEAVQYAATIDANTANFDIFPVVNDGIYALNAQVQVVLALNGAPELDVYNPFVPPFQFQYALRSEQYIAGDIIAKRIAWNHNAAVAGRLTIIVSGYLIRFTL